MIIPSLKGGRGRGRGREGEGGREGGREGEGGRGRGGREGEGGRGGALFKDSIILIVNLQEYFRRKRPKSLQRHQHQV